eukprot:NODE_394_length_9435_cov_0.160347.p2 type:complete len:399 gc:universal NODE_394_length_9435_cov_0.160347:6500-5304(-)
MNPLVPFKWNSMSSVYFAIQLLRNIAYFGVMTPVLLVVGLIQYLKNIRKSLLLNYIELFLKHGIRVNPPGRRGAFEFVRFITSFPIHNFTRFCPKNYNIQEMVIPVNKLSVEYHPWLNKSAESFKGEMIYSNVQSDHLILYTHGGAFHFLSPMTHRSFTCKITDATGVNLFAIQQKLAPEHEFKESILDVINAYVHFTNLNYKVTLMGDSSGGGTLLSAYLFIKDIEITQPFSIILLSPWIDLSISGPSWKENLGKCFLEYPLPGLNECTANMIYPLNANHPFASPLFGDFRGCNVPILIQTGFDELIRDDSIRLYLKLKDEKYNLHSYSQLLDQWDKEEMLSCEHYIRKIYKNVELQVFPHSFHFFQIFGGKYSVYAIDEIKHFIRDIKAEDPSHKQ